MSKNCPICTKKTTIKFTPFCSIRCANLDLSKWLEGSYSFPTNETGEININEFEKYR